MEPEALEDVRAVRWAPVNAAALALLREFGTQADLLEAIESPPFEHLRIGLRILLEQPIVATPDHITDGAHRIIAMREQGERWTVGWRIVPAHGVPPVHDVPVGEHLWGTEIFRPDRSSMHPAPPHREQ